jgi:small subunit ribosomal protein S11
MTRQRSRKRDKKVFPNGKAFVNATFNNTQITLTDVKGDVIVWASAGTSGFKGSRKGTAYAAQRAAEQCAKRALDLGLRQVEVIVRGPGAGREAAIRSLQTAGMVTTSIRDLTPVPHNGCRPPKRRRV